MSWDSYIDNLIGQSAGHIDRGALCGQDGSLWTSGTMDTHLKINSQEAATIAKVLRDGKVDDNALTELQMNGISVEGTKYQFLRGDFINEKVILAKLKGHGAITIQYSKTAFVIGHTKEGGQQGNANKGVSIIAEYLESLGM